VTPAEPIARCTLHGALGRLEPCPGAQCALWDAAEDVCVLGDIEFEIVYRPPLAAHLLELRSALESR
jgi:hypothetical protein